MNPTTIYPLNAVDRQNHLPFNPLPSVQENENGQQQLSPNRHYCQIPIQAQLTRMAAWHNQHILHLGRQGSPWAIAARCYDFANALADHPYSSFLQKTHLFCLKLFDDNFQIPCVDSPVANILRDFKALSDVIDATNSYLEKESQKSTVPEQLLLKIDQAKKIIGASKEIVEKTLKILGARTIFTLDDSSSN